MIFLAYKLHKIYDIFLSKMPKINSIKEIIHRKFSSIFLRNRELKESSREGGEHRDKIRKKRQELEWDFPLLGFGLV
jgi:hypothetical protein